MTQMLDQARLSIPPVTNSPPLVEARGLQKRFRLSRQRFFEPAPTVLAVDDVSFKVLQGTTFGLVGESGSGKTTVAKMLLKLEQPSAGTLLVDGKDVFQQDASSERLYRRTVQAVLQDPYGALSPRLRVGRIIAEPLVAQGRMSWKEGEAKAAELMDLVGLRRDALHKYPHEFSGGQRQRIAIARAMVLQPRFVVLDEPTSALDRSVQGQIVALLRRLQKDRGLGYLFISHDLTVVRALAHRVVVMRRGRVVEEGPADQVFATPAEPYTKALMAAAFGLDITNDDVLAACDDDG